MKQLNLFPPPGALTQPLPDDLRVQARHLLAELLVAVLGTAAEEPIRSDGESHEQDPANAS